MRFSRLLGALAALAMAFPALAYDDPRSLVEAIYQPYMNGQQQANLAQFYSAGLKQLFLDHANAKAQEQDVTGSVPTDIEPALGFNPFIDGDNALLHDVKIGEPVIVGDKALITVAFHNFDEPTLLTLSLIKEPDGWKVDDVTSTGGEQKWMLSWLLLYDPWGGM
jgi:hypothetical protein